MLNEINLKSYQRLIKPNFFKCYVVVKIRKASQKDLDNLHDMHKGLIEYEFEVDPLIKKSNSYYSIAKKDYKSALLKRNHIFFIAEDNNIPLGYIYGWIEKPPKSFIPNKRGYICDAYVKPKGRNKGVGKKLTSEILKFFKSKNVSWIKLGVYAKNVNSVKIWRKLGFEDYTIDMIRMI